MRDTAHGRVGRCNKSFIYAAGWLALTGAAHATTPVYVDPAGVCNLQIDCFTTIQAAVRNAHDPDGPGPGNTLLAEVFVFPGAYAESVDLTQMGADVNDVPGDIRIVSVNAAGVPTPGTASVNPPSGPAFFIPELDEFLGAITLDGFNVTSFDTHAVDLDEVDGPVALVNLTALNAAGRGISVIDTIVRTNPGDLTVTNCTANGNVNHGMDLQWLENVSVTACTANGNIGATAVGIDVRAGINAVLTNCNADDNDFRGFEAEAVGTIEMTGCGADDNGEIGINIVYLFAPANDVTLTNCSAHGNGAEGIGVRHLFLGNGNVSLADCSADGNFQDGIFVLADRNAMFVRCTADDNMDDGMFCTNGTRGDVTFTDCAADGNAEDGISILNADNVTMTDTTSTNNGERGFSQSFATGDVSFTDCTGSDNGEGGINGNAEGTMTVLRCEAHRNGFSGINVGGGTFVAVRQCAANENVANNFGQVLLGGNGIDASGGASVEIVDSVANDNHGTGISGGSVAGDVVVTRCTANDNGEPGVFAGGVGIGAFSGTDASISRCTARDNLLDGVNVGFAIVVAGPLPTIREVAILDSVIRGNGQDGIDLLAVDPNNGAKTIRGNLICENVRSGLRVVDNVAVNAEGNWWGSHTGPTHPANAAGLGDDVLDGANGAGGTVDFDPFVDTISTSVSTNPASAGQPTVVSFQFFGGGGTVFLGQGPGDPNGPPTFVVSTDNGTLTSPVGTGATVGAFIGNLTGLLSVTLVPAISGVATVTLEDFCNLTATVPVDVDRADLSLTKHDHADPIISVDPLIYTLTVTNAGPTDATNVTIVDTLPASTVFDSTASSQGICFETNGVVTCNLGTLPAGTSTDVTITVFATVMGTITNTATVSSDQDDPDLSNNSASEDTFVVTPTGQGTSTGDGQSDGGEEDCGAGMCGFGTIGAMPMMFAGVGLMKRRRRPMD